MEVASFTPMPIRDGGEPLEFEAIPTGHGIGPRPNKSAALSSVLRFVVTLNLFAAAAVPAGVNHWTPVGPIGLRTDSFIGTILIDRIHPSIIYAAADIYAQPVPYASVFKSTNGGDTWVEMNSGLPVLSIQGIRALAIDPIATTKSLA